MYAVRISPSIWRGRPDCTIKIESTRFYALRTDHADTLQAARGILSGLVISACLWAGLSLTSF